MKKKTVVCTLFENQYHYGVAALANSLYKQGFRGDFYAGYRGSLPFWTESAVNDPNLKWTGSSTLKVAKGFQIHFLPIITDYHFTNYKPDLMIELWKGIAKDAETMLYFDPDIVLTAPWSFIEKWAEDGIAVCEDLKSPLEKFHPRRMGWRKYYKKFGIELKFKNSIYVNGGFIGLSKNKISFLEQWKMLQEFMGELIGGLNRSTITKETKLSDEFSFDYSPFGATDQDALNATIEACDFEISYMRKEAMALDLGAPVLMPHALGTPKPWAYKPINSFLKGKGPRLVDKVYWDCVAYPIRCYPDSKIKLMGFTLKCVSFLNRFYKNS